MLAPKAFADLDGVRAAADRINAANEQRAARGMTLGYHNHFWEMPRSTAGPRCCTSSTSSTTRVFAEVDIYWAQVGGIDPEGARRRARRPRRAAAREGRARRRPAESMVAVGDGAVDIPGVLAASPSARWHIVELDRCDTDMFDAVERSYDYLVGNGFSRGTRE